MKWLMALLACLPLLMPAPVEGTVLKDTKNCWMETVHLRVEEGLLYMTIDGNRPYQPVTVRESFVEAVRTLEESGEQYDLDPDRMERELYELLDDSLTGGARVADMDVQHDQIMLLLEGPGDRLTLRIATWKGDGYNVLDNPGFPAGSVLDSIHGEGSILIWVPAEYGELGVYLVRDEEDGSNWLLGVRTDMLEWDFEWRWHAVVIPNETKAWTNDGYFYGESPVVWSFGEFDLAAFPFTLEQAMARLDRSGWAAVNNPNPADRLNLRAEPSNDAASLGEFYNKTPVRVIDAQGEWSQVIIGEKDDGFTGWMMTKYLVFGEDMDAVACAFPRDEGATDERGLFTAREEPDMGDLVSKWSSSFEGSSIIGVLGDEWYIVMDHYEGWVGYVPQSWFVPKNEET